MYSRTLVAAVREMMERHWDVYSIATKLRLDPMLVQAVVDFINNVVT